METSGEQRGMYLIQEAEGRRGAGREAEWQREARPPYHTNDPGEPGSKHSQPTQCQKLKSSEYTKRCTRHQDSKGNVFTFCGPFSNLKAKQKSTVLRLLHSFGDDLKYKLHPRNISPTPTQPVPKGCPIRERKKQNTEPKFSSSQGN